MNLDADEYEFDALDEIDLDRSLTRTEKIVRMRALADDTERGTELRMSTLSALADHLQAEGRVPECRAVLAELAEDSDNGLIQSRIHLLDLELEVGNDDEADVLLRHLLEDSRAGRLSIHDHAMVAEAQAYHDRERGAVRWYTIPIRSVRPQDLDDRHYHCVNRRYRVRRDLGLPIDVYDEASEEIMEMLRQERNV